VRFGSVRPARSPRRERRRREPGTPARRSRGAWGLACAGLAVGSLVLLDCALGYLSPHYALPSERRERLNEAANRYVSFLRFGNLPMAAPFVEPDLRGRFLSAFGGEARAAVHFTELEVADVQFGPEVGRATVTVYAHVYRPPSVREVVVTETQHWRYDPRAGCWYVSPDFSVYGAPGSARAGSASQGP
jgi:hypothetical protein